MEEVRQQIKENALESYKQKFLADVERLKAERKAKYNNSEVDNDKENH